MEKSFYTLWDWKEAEDLAFEIYRITSHFPIEERYSLTSQLRSAATSVFSNIAEGSGRSTIKDYIRFLVQARASTQEILAQLSFTRRLKYISDEDYENMFRKYNRLAASINNHINSLRKNNNFVQ